MQIARQAVITTEGLQALLDTLRGRGYRVVGPTLRDQATIYDDIASVADLPKGWGDEMAGAIGLSEAMTRRCSATPSARIRGRSFSIRRCCASGGPSAMAPARSLSRIQIPLR